MKGIESGAIGDITTQGLSALHDLIINASDQRRAADQIVSDVGQALQRAEQDTAAARQLHDEAEQRLARLEASWFRSFRGGAIAATKKRIEQLANTTTGAKKQADDLRAEKYAAEQHRDELWVDTEFDLSGPAHAAWTKVCDAFSALSSSQGIWDITAYRDKRSGEERSAATKVIDRKPVKLSSSELSVIESKYQALRWQNANGEDLFLYPGLMIVFRNQANFAMLDLNEIECAFEERPFQESEVNPTDSKQIGTWWLYSNRDGTPDRRYTNNRESPTYLYAQIHWKSMTGLSEAYLFSNAQAAARFVDALTDFRHAVQGGQPNRSPAISASPLDRLDVRMSNFRQTPGTTVWNFDTDIRCRQCGGVPTVPDDRTDQSVVTCKGCGAEIGSYGHLVAALKVQGQDELRKRGLVPTEQK